MRKLFLTSVSIFIAFCCVAQDSGVQSPLYDTAYNIEEEELDTKVESDFAKEVLGDTTITFNDFSVKKDTVSALKLKKEYSWITNIDSFLLAQKKEERKQSKITSKENSGSSFLSNFFSSGILQVVMWIIAGSVVLFIIYKLFLSEAVFGRRRTKAAVSLLDDSEDESLANDYEALLQKAYQEGDLRFAMRFLFLKTLQRLNERELIKYSVDKTNSVYVSELPEAKKNDFASLALYYEYVWYGKVDIQKNVFDSIETKFNNFLNKI